MKLSGLVQICADCGLAEKPTLSTFARILREAGRIPTEGRRYNAADMTSLHIARFIIALLATDYPTKAVDAERRFSELKNRANDRLDDYLSDLIDKNNRKFRVFVERNRLSVTIRFNDDEMIFHSGANSYHVGKDVSAYLRHHVFAIISNQLKQEK
jgi:hypothetical protein